MTLHEDLCFGRLQDPVDETLYFVNKTSLLWDRKRFSDALPSLFLQRAAVPIAARALSLADVVPRSFSSAGLTVGADLPDALLEPFTGRYCSVHHAQNHGFRCRPHLLDSKDWLHQVPIDLPQYWCLMAACALVHRRSSVLSATLCLSIAGEVKYISKSFPSWLVMNLCDLMSHPSCVSPAAVALTGSCLSSLRAFVTASLLHVIS